MFDLFLGGSCLGMRHANSSRFRTRSMEESKAAGSILGVAVLSWSSARAANGTNSIKSQRENHGRRPLSVAFPVVNRRRNAGTRRENNAGDRCTWSQDSQKGRYNRRSRPGMWCLTSHTGFRVNAVSIPVNIFRQLRSRGKQDCNVSHTTIPNTPLRGLPDGFGFGHSSALALRLAAKVHATRRCRRRERPHFHRKRVPSRMAV